jgi:hypothetical protein
VVINGYSINGYWGLFYQWLLVGILLLIIGVILLMVIDGYSTNGYWWLFY